ncbi:MAG: S41 family peptidase [Proteobacteria bacterium]|nr:S41 family peptidase [Pseudomonadota bacterium]
MLLSNFKRLFFSLTLVLASCSPQPVRNHDSQLTDQFSGSGFLYIDSADRQKIIRDLKEMVIDNYTLLKVKSVLGIVADPTKLFDDAIAKEAQLEVSTNESFDQAKSNLQFLDRVRELIANFQDTHFSTNPIVARSGVLTGLSTENISGQIVVTAIQPAILAYAASQSTDADSVRKIKVGLQIVSIDGVDAVAAASELKPFISSSTPQWRDYMAALYLSSRSFHLPEKSHVDFELKSSDGSTFKVRLPYFYRARGASARKDELVYFAKVGIESIAKLQLQFSAETNRWLPSMPLGLVGYDLSAAPAGLIGETVWNSVEEDGSTGDITFRTGYILKQGQAFGVLQSFEYSSSEVSQESPGKTAKNTKKFVEVVEDFVSELKSQNVPLILDLRNNGGGNPMNAIGMMAALARKDEVYPSTTRALRVTRIIRQMLEQIDQGKIPDLNSYDYDETALQEIRKAIASKSEYTSAFTLTSDIRASERVGGYDQKIIALITPNCISACDGMAILLKQSKRATLIGTVANGTGAGFIGDGSFEDIQWRDRYQVVSIRLPNRMFGFGGKVGEHIISEADAFIKYNSENRPVEADIKYEATTKDYFKGASSGWYEKAIEALTK